MLACAQPAPRPEESSSADQGEGLVGLIARVARGEQPALAELYDRTHHPVFSLCWRVLRDREDAEEVTLDVYLQVWQIAKRYEPGRGSALTWILTLARSRAIDRLRALGARRRKESRILHGHPVSSPEPAPELAAQRGELETRVARALSRLPRTQACVLELACAEGLTHVEIAERLGQPLGTVKTRIRLGLERLRRSLGGLEVEA